MHFNPYLHFNGNCQEAFTFYADVFAGAINAVHLFGGSPMAGQVPPEWHNKVMHISMTAQGQTLMGSDAGPGRYQPVQGFSVSINLTNPAEAERIFHRLAAGGTTEMPIQKTFWSERFGMCVDRFGIPWMINCHNPQ